MLASLILRYKMSVKFWISLIWDIVKFTTQVTEEHISYMQLINYVKYFWLTLLFMSPKLFVVKSIQI